MMVDEFDYEIAEFDLDFTVLAWYMKEADEPVFKAHTRIDGPEDIAIGPWRQSYEEAQLDIINYMAVQRA